jgi:pSer/pThr/pTyr-binding forkhead associated (FHA) protein
MVTSAVLIASDGSRYAVENVVTIGRVADRDISIDDGRISRLHAEVVLREGMLTVEDKGSSNGTKVNGTAVSGATPLSHGDAVAFDVHVFLVELDGQPIDISSAEAAVDGDVTQLRIPDAGPSAPTVKVPQAWTESPGGDHTQFVAMGNASSAPAGAPARQSTLAHLLVVGAGGHADKVDLPTGEAGAQDVWEIGRTDSCDIAFDDPSMSQRHAQLIHENGSWRMVNLVSTNGIVVNGEKRLSVYLSDGDLIQLGGTTLAFYGIEGGSPVAPSGGAASTTPKKVGGGSSKLLPIALGAVIAIAAALALYFL